MRALPPAPGFRVNGLGLGTLAQAAIRSAREKRTREAAVSAPLAPVAPAPADPASALARLLRQHALGALYVEAERLAQLAAIHRENVEGLTYGRTYGDPDLAGQEPAPCLVPILAEATRRADMAGALADLIHAMIGRESAVAQALSGGAGV